MVAAGVSSKGRFSVCITADEFLARGARKKPPAKVARIRLPVPLPIEVKPSIRYCTVSCALMPPSPMRGSTCRSRASDRQHDQQRWQDENLHA